MKQNNPVSGRDSHDMFHVIDVERKKMAEKKWPEKTGNDLM